MTQAVEDIGFDEGEALVEGDTLRVDGPAGPVDCVVLAVVDLHGVDWALLLPPGQDEADDPEVLVARLDAEGRPVVEEGPMPPGLRAALVDLLELADGSAGEA